LILSHVAVPALTSRGYTLLELLVVILLLGVISGLAIPRLYALYESATRAFEREDLRRQIAALGYRAYVEARGFTLGDEEDTSLRSLPLAPPDGWQVAVTKPIAYHSNGVCSGGTLMLKHGGREEYLTLEPPLCQPSPQ
jgi:general secretion pathway protein G